MARQVLPIVGAVVGAYFGGPQGAQIGFAIGSLVGNAVDPLEVAGNRVGDSPVQTASEGGARAIVFGKGCIRSTCVLERGNRRVIKTRTEQGKGGGPITINERALWTYSIGIGEDLVGGGLLRIWENEKLVYDVTETSTIPEDTIEFAKKFRFYNGAETQLPDPAEEAIHGVGNSPYYRGTARCVFPDYDLTDFGETVPTYRWEVAKSIEAIVPATLIVTGRVSAVVNAAVFGADPSSFNTARSVPFSGGKPVACINGRQLIFSNNRASYTDNEGITWTDSIESFPGNPMNSGDSRDGIVVLASGLGGVARSSDNGASFDMVAVPGHRPNYLCFDSNLTLASVSSTDPLIWTSPDTGLSWSSGFPHGVFLGSGGCITGSDGVLGIGGRYTPTGFPAITIQMGAILETYPITSSIGTHVSAAKYWQSLDKSMLVFGTDEGEMYWTDNLGLTINKSTFSFASGSSVEGITHNGTYWWACGRESGELAFSPTGKNDWTVITQPLANTIVGLAALPERPTVATGAKVPLYAIVSAIHGLVGQEAGDYEVSELDDMLVGAVIQATVSGADAIKSIIANYFADPADYDGKLRYIKRGKPVVRTLIGDLTDDCDLIDEPESSQRNNAIEYPRKLHLFFESSLAAYATTKATSARYSDDVAVVGEASLATPVTFDDAMEPHEIAVKSHKVWWTEAEGEIIWRVTDEHLDLVPTDTVGLSYRGQLRRARILTIEDDPGERKLKMVIDRQSSYRATLTEVPAPPPPTPPQSSIVAPAITAILDIPALTDSADILGYYGAMSGSNDNWAGGVLQRSLDLGASYTSVTSTQVNSIMGVLVAPVSPGSRHYTDGTNRVVIELYTEDELESISDTQFLSEAGAFALSYETDEGRQWEILQGRDIEQDSDGNWVISTLHRGVLNTETPAHEVGALFVWIDASLMRVTAQTSWIGTSLTHRGVSNGLSPETAAPQTLTFQGFTQREWPVGHVFLEHDGTDIHVSIVPRHRFGTDVNPIRSVNWDGYQIEFRDSTDQIQTLDTTSNEYTFDATFMTFPVEVSVAQLNRLTGVGPVVTEEVA